MALSRSIRLVVAFLALACVVAVPVASAHGAGHLGSARAVERAHTHSGQAPAARGQRLFSGTRISSFAMNQSAPGAISEVANPTGGKATALQMTVANSDVYPITPTDNPRAQLLSPNLFNPGDEFWWHSKFFLPA
ncbi:MAG TPA: hypothetical protein VH299_07750, partial [Solirubrobacterales bacterium]|nr:hypothetical protein [Solirubrobacterales bacterium]